jgi:hypothetical protein
MNRPLASRGPRLLLGALAVAVLSACTPGRSVPPSPAPATTSATAADVAWGDRPYILRSGLWELRNCTLHDGRGTATIDYRDGGANQDVPVRLEDVTVAEVNGDGVEEAIVRIVEEDDAQAGHWYAVFTILPDGPYQLGALFTPGRLFAMDGVLVLDEQSCARTVDLGSGELRVDYDERCLDVASATEASVDPYAHEGPSCERFAVQPAAAEGPRPVAPLTNSVAGRRPAFRWSPAASDARVDVCADPACRRVVVSLEGTGGTVVPQADLPTGLLFWRVGPRSGAGARAGSVRATSSAKNSAQGAEPPPRDRPVWRIHVLRGAVRGRIADLNGDGLVDMGDFRQWGRVFLGSSRRGRADRGSGGGAARLRSMEEQSVSTNPAMWTSIVNDVNGDGYDDLLLGGAVGDGIWELRLGSPDGPARDAVQDSGQRLDEDEGDGSDEEGAFEDDTYEETGAGYQDTAEADADALFAGLFFAVSAGDVNGDGYADFLANSRSDSRGSVSLLLLGGRDGIERQPVLVTDPGISVVGDADGDGLDDLARSVSRGPDEEGEEGGRVLLLPGAPGGPSCDPTREVLFECDACGRGGTAPGGDLNGDGRADLVVSAPSPCDCCQDCSDMPDELRVLYADLDRPALPPTAIPGPNGVYNAIKALGGLDMDADGFGDVLIVHGPAVFLGRGSPDGLLPEPTPLELPIDLEEEGEMDSTTELEAVLAGDVDGDGIGDALVYEAYKMGPDDPRAWIVGSARGPWRLELSTIEP